jgi:uncharacterized protein YjeT (DUF2065 family)
MWDFLTFSAAVGLGVLMAEGLAVLFTIYVWRRFVRWLDG